MTRAVYPSEVHALVYAAYVRGRYDADLHDLHGTWAEHREPRATREQRVAQRIAEMEQHAERVSAALGRPPGWTYPGGPVDWETGAPVRRLEIAA